MVDASNGRIGVSSAAGSTVTLVNAATGATSSQWALNESETSSKLISKTVWSESGFVAFKTLAGKLHITDRYTCRWHLFLCE